MTIEERVTQLENRLNAFDKLDRELFNKLIQIYDGRNIQVGKTIGTKIGTETSQKIGFFGHAPVIQQTASANAASILAVLQAYGLSA